MNFLLLALSLAIGLVGGLVVLLVVLRHVTQRQVQDQQTAVGAAVAAALAERGATAETLERDREATVQAAVARAAEVADAKLDARMRQGTEQLDARMRQGTDQISASTTTFEKQTAEMNAEMRRMQKMVTDLQRHTAGQQGAVLKGLEEAARATTQLQQTTGGLREALASPKARGQWGERMAEDVLRAAGFQEGVNFRKQQAIASGGIPDITFMMPKNMVLHMDVKFPVDNYLRHLEAHEVNDPRADDYRTQFRRDAKAKISELAARNYADGSDSVDYVLLFMPNESVYSFVHENDPGIIDTALAAKVVLCGPSTLFAVLAVIRQAMDNFMLERRGEEIMDCLAQFSTEWGKFSEQIDKVGKHLDTVQNSFGQLQGTRSNVMQKKLRRIDDLQNQREVGVPADREWPQLREVVSA
jgi:DNA recombination protein RmuC